MTHHPAWPLDREGFVQHFMVSGPKVTAFSSETSDSNLLRFESSLRMKIARYAPVPDAETVDESCPGRLGLPWRFQGGSSCTLLNLSGFYPTMKRVEFDAASVLISPDERTVSAVLWSYAAVDLYCNGARIGSLEHPVYKPIQRKVLDLPLRKGRNVIYLACETLGVRDTRSVVGLQLLEGREGIAVSLPDEKLAESVAPALEFIEGIRLSGSRLLFPFPAPAGSSWTVSHGYVADHVKAHLPPVWQPLDGASFLEAPESSVFLTVQTPAGAGTIRRIIERTDQILPQVVRPAPSREENFRLILRRIADIESFDRGEEFGFPIASLLARQALSCPAPGDEALLEETLRLIEERVDCADFLVCGLVRYLKNYPVSKALKAHVRQVLTGWRYWMDQDGFDGMCFWSENHCLMFYASAMQAGEMYPDDWFPLARRTGAQLSSWGREMIRLWIDDVEQYGFEEFHSTVYMCVTLAALLNVIDYADPEISDRAARLTDRMLNLLAVHTFRGGIIAPQGRVYRGALYPFLTGAMALMNLADPTQPWDLGEGWLSFYATSKYRFPEEMPSLMAREASLDYTSGNARIRLEKHEDWCLTSVQIPREPFRRWENIARRPDADPSGHAFVKSFNECFHGTTCFQPGVFGYQQHLWYAALDGEAVLFINHPGSSSEGGDMRPGYWHGSGVFPALKQEKNLLGLIWRIPEEHPFHYVHLYAPSCRFDEIRQQGHWLLFRKGQGYIGLWSSVLPEPWSNMNFDCEQRFWGSEAAFVCLCAGREVPDLDAFACLAESKAPAYDPEKALLTAGDFSLTWTQGQDTTQYL